MERTLRANMAPQLAGVLIWLAGSVLGLRDVQVSVPEAVGVGSSAILGCRWALDAGEALYTVKWYHGAQEFFRFVPKELPNTRVFYQTGINVDIYRSGAHQVVLRDATRGLSGRYRCEVSADAPFFHTVYKTALLKVVELPESGPRVHSQKSWYSVGDMLQANCSSPPADPPANLTWLLNGREVKGLDIPVYDIEARSVIKDTSLENANKIIFSPWEAVRSYETTEHLLDVLQKRYEKNSQRDEVSSASLKPSLIELKSNFSSEEERGNRTSSFSRLVMRVQALHFRKGRLNVTCVARVYSVWSASRVLIVDEERPHIAPVMGSIDSNAGVCLPSHLMESDDEDEDHTRLSKRSPSLRILQ